LPSVLVHYATTHGHTEKIATALGEALGGEGVDVSLVRASDDTGPDPAEFDGVIVAGSLHAGKHQAELARWATDHSEALDGRPTLFVSVSLTAAEDEPEAQEATQRCIQEFIEETGWRPGRTAAVAGALQYREYDVFVRTLMRLKMKQGGHPTDSSHDYDYTDWDAVERLGRDFARRLGD
jgi:menaquinone-dependent protoporphyrinogen oxidase